MAIATSTNYYASSIIGIPGAGADIDIHERNTTPRFAVGFGFERSDGNKFRYVQYSTAVSAGSLVGNLTTGTYKASTDALVVATGTAAAVANEIIKPGDIGSRYVEITLASIAANQFAGGYFVPTKDTGAGYVYRIKGNTATGNPVSGNFRLELYEKIKVKLDNTTDIAIAPSKYVNLAPTNPVSGTVSNVVGVVMAPATADNYGWVCTRGICAALASTTGITYGAAIANAIVTTGSYMEFDTTTALAYRQIGTCIVPAGAAAAYGIINLQLE
jgi:hypothetical protein